MERRQFVLAAAALLSAPLACASVDSADLRALAERDGAVRVIATLALPAIPPPSPEAIRDAQERLIAALRGTRYSGLRRYSGVPQVALAAGPDALEVLLASPLVASVAADARARPMTPERR